MKNNKKAFSLIIAMGLVLVSSLLAYTMLEYIIPFGKNIKGIENSTMSYYKANSGIEDGLYHFATRDDLKSESGAIFSGVYSFAYNTFSSGSRLPETGKGNSEYNSDWNRIALGEPVQLSIGEGSIIDWQDVIIKFRIPDLNSDGDKSVDINNDETLVGDTNFPIINWQLSSDSATINAYTGELIKVDEIDGNEIDLKDRQGVNLSNTAGNDQKISTFYGVNCLNVSNKCSLKFSVINKLIEYSNNSTVPYLEWYIDLDPLNTNNGNNIPLRFSRIEASGKSYGYKKSLGIKIPQVTVSEAFDFTVFQ